MKHRQPKKALVTLLKSHLISRGADYLYSGNTESTPFEVVIPGQHSFTPNELLFAALDDIAKNAAAFGTDLGRAYHRIAREVDLLETARYKDQIVYTFVFTGPGLSALQPPQDGYAIKR